ncbi:MAG TPA: hypothetical protein VEA59_06250 [Patescibacteria group bacterium]|nr:hypothetical protein [Patescibacteria group bacterium]
MFEILERKPAGVSEEAMTELYKQREAQESGEAKEKINAIIKAEIDAVSDETRQAIPSGLSETLSQRALEHYLNGAESTPEFFAQSYSLGTNGEKVALSKNSYSYAFESMLRSIANKLTQAFPKKMNVTTRLNLGNPGEPASVSVIFEKQRTQDQ